MLGSSSSAFCFRDCWRQHGLYGASFSHWPRGMATLGKNPMRKQSSLCRRAREWARTGLPTGLSTPTPASSVGSNGRKELLGLSHPPTPRHHIQPSLQLCLGSSPISTAGHLPSSFRLLPPLSAAAQTSLLQKSSCFLSRHCQEGAGVRRCLYRQELRPSPATDQVLC